MARMSLSLNIEKVMEIVEEFLKRKNARFEVKRFRTRYGLRYIEYRLGFLKKIKIFSYMWGAEIILPRGFKELKSILSVYELKLPEKPKIKDRWDYVLELQIYEKKVGMVKRAIAIRTVMLLLIGAFVENVYPDSGLKFVLAFLPILLLIPAQRGWGQFVEPSEWAIPVLYPYYRMRIRRLKERCNEI